MEGYYDKKLIISGKYIEFYKYHTPIYRIDVYKPDNDKKIYPYRELRLDNLTRTKTNVIRLINSNPDMDKFLTLTYSHKMQDLSESNILFKNFILRLRRKFNKFKYFTVPEFQLKNTQNVHYHMLSNLPYIPTWDIQNLYWREGICYVEKTESITNLGLYMSKYLNKDFENDRYCNKRKFLTSGNLDKPRILKGDEVVTWLDFFKGAIEITFKTQFDSAFAGVIDYYSGYLNL